MVGMYIPQKLLNVGWFIPVIPELGRLWKENFQKFIDSLGYMSSDNKAQK